MFRARNLGLVATAFLVLAASAIPTRALAIPYFARKYKTTCSRCHTAVPKLNTFGKNFQLHGYQQPGDKLVNKITFPEDKNLTVIDQLPIAFLIENQVQLDKAVGNQNADSIAAPFVYHLFAADTFAPDIGFFTELASQGGATNLGKVDAIFSHLGNQNIFGEVGNLDVTEHGVTEHDLFGRSGFAVQDLGLASAGSPFVFSAQHTGARIYGLIGSNVTPDLIHGKTTGADRPKGSGLPNRLYAMNKGQGKATPDETGDEEDPMDRQTGFLVEAAVFNSTNVTGNPMTPNPSDFQGRVNTYFGGDSFVGIQGYSGLCTVGASGVPNRFRLWGPDFSLNFGKKMEKSKGLYIKPYNLFGGYISGQVDNPNDDGRRVKYDGYFLEQDVALTNRSMAFVRYDRVNSAFLQDLSPTSTNAVTLNYSYWIRTNFWLGVEYTRDVSGHNLNALGVLFDFAF